MNDTATRGRKGVGASVPAMEQVSELMIWTLPFLDTPRRLSNAMSKHEYVMALNSCVLPVPAGIRQICVNMARYGRGRSCQ